MFNTHKHSIILGATGFWPWQRYTLPEEERKAHMYVVGTTTRGKSKLLEYCLYQDIRAGNGAGVIDPHGDLADDLLRYLATKRSWWGLGQAFADKPGNLDRLVYLDPARRDYCLGLNPLEMAPDDDRYEVAANIVEVFRRLWPSSLEEAPVFQDVMLNSLLVLMEHHLTLLELPRLLTDRDYRESLLPKVGNPSVAEFFHSRFDRWGREQSLRVESTLNKVSALVTS
jgi:hypothetical protein